jgi:hypothetical protein
MVSSSKSEVNAKQHPERDHCSAVSSFSLMGGGCWGQSTGDSSMKNSNKIISSGVILPTQQHHQVR